MENKRIYPPTQLIVALDSKVLKVYLWICSWSAQGSIKYYPRQFAKACKMEENEVERCIQSLEDAKLIDSSYIDQTWVITPNAEQNQKYYSVPISKVLEGKGIQMADKVTWNVVETKDDDSDEDLQRQILMLQARLNERAQLKKKVVTMAAATVNNDDIDSLPF